AAAAPQRRCERTGAGATCALLAPRLLPAASHFSHRFGGGSAAALCRHVSNHNVVNGLVALARFHRLEGEIQTSRFLPLTVLNRKLHFLSNHFLAFATFAAFAATMALDFFLDPRITT